MKPIDNLHLQKLRDNGLFVSEPYPQGHVLEFGVIVGKPTQVGGNFIPEFETAYDEIRMNAPMLTLFSTGKIWLTHVQEHIPDPGAGDFTNEWNSPEEAINDILDYYFGNPARMKR